MDSVTLLHLRKKRKAHLVKDSIRGIKNFFYNPEEKKILGRDYKHIGPVILFYCAFYLCLAALFLLMTLFFLYIIIDANEPFRTGMNNLMKGNPGLSFRPIPEVDSTLIRFLQGQPYSYKMYMDHMQTYLSLYERGNQDDENIESCEILPGQSYPTPREGDLMERVCRIDIEEEDKFGTDCIWEKDFGFDEGTPCVLLKLNSIYDWIPLNYEEDEIPKELNNSGKYNKGYIAITCQGETPVDTENMGTVTYYPNNGIPFYYFPYRNQEGYRSPFVFVRFENATNGVLLNIYCKAWAKNLHHHRGDSAASVHFELLID